MIKNIKSKPGYILYMCIVLMACGIDDISHIEKHFDKNHSNEIILSSLSVKEIGLQTQLVSSLTMDGNITIPAQVFPNQDYEAQIGSLVQGRVYKVFVKSGDYVKAGQDLMHVEGLEIGEIKAGFLSARANLDYQKAAFERQKVLIEQQIGSKKTFLQAKAEYEKALAEYNAHDKKIHSIGLTDDEVIDNENSEGNEHTSGTLSVKAPISGIVVDRNVVIGQFVDATTNAFRIINTSSVWIEGQLYEKDLNIISDVRRVVFTTPTFPDEKFFGNVFYIGHTIAEKSRTIPIKAEFNNPDSKLKPHMYGEMLVPAVKKSKAIYIPAGAIVKMDNADFVFVQEADSIFVKRSVTTGIEHNQKIEIRDGLNEKDKVVVKGAFYLKSELLKDEFEGDEH